MENTVRQIMEEDHREELDKYIKVERLSRKLLS